jgi:hypothetical protein
MKQSENLMTKRTTKVRKRQAVRSTASFGTLDDFLKDQGKLEEFQVTAIKEVLAEQAKTVSKPALRRAKALTRSGARATA